VLAIEGFLSDGAGQGLGRTAALYDAFGVLGTIFRELEWKTPIFSWRVDPKTPNTSYHRFPLHTRFTKRFGALCV
jgi:hypothetical protein